MGVISYVKTVWKARKEGGTPVSPENLNNIENGIEEAIKQINLNVTNIQDTSNEQKKHIRNIAIHSGIVSLNEVSNSAYYRIKFYADKGTALFLWQRNYEAFYGVELLHFKGAIGGSVHIAGTTPPNIIYEGVGEDNMHSFKVTGLEKWSIIDVISHRCAEIVVAQD